MRKLVWAVAMALIVVGCGKKKDEPSKTAIDDGKRVVCANNLKQLWHTQNSYMIQYGGRQQLLPKETGGAFWLKLSQSPTVLIDASLQEVYACPFKTPRHGATDYRGPAGDVNQFGEGDAMGACIGNHPDGSAVVLRKSGDVQTVKEGDALYQKALETTKP